MLSITGGGVLRSGAESTQEVTDTRTAKVGDRKGVDRLNSDSRSKNWPDEDGRMKEWP